MNVLEIRGVSKNFGTKSAVAGVSFSVPENSIYGFIGANGAGKTTTMKMILGLMKRDAGEIFVCGERVTFGATKTNRLVGYLPDVPEFYGYMRPKEYLKLCGEIVGLSPEKIKARTAELLELVGLSDANKKIKGFSRGMKQRLGMAQALISEPKLLICDEPTSALDPIGRKEILDILLQLKGKTTVVFSTHILSDVERICDSIAVINHGKIVLKNNIADLKIAKKSKTITLEYDTETDAADVQRVLAENNLAPARCEAGELSLENLFMEVAAS
jgi:ABC-2 type transport system ATP-binding protein